MSDTKLKDTAKRALGLLDLTSLNDTDTEETTAALCDKAVTPAGPVAAVCVWPKFVTLCAEKLHGKGVKIATVVNFPAGGTDIDATVAETTKAAQDGANEIDLVFPYRAYMDGDKEIAARMVRDVKKACGKAKLKVILETGEIKKALHIAAAGRIALENGADFLKTSTGKTKISATHEAANAMLETLRDTSSSAGFKASGGIRTTAEAYDYLALADMIMGKKWVSPKTFRFGASSLLDDLLATLGYGEKPTDSTGY